MSTPNPTTADQAPPATRSRELRLSDVRAVARLHLTLFPDYFLSRLGPAFLERFYAGFAGSGPDLGFVAESAGEVVGFVVGTTEPRGVYRRFYRRHALRLGPAFLRRCLTDAAVRRAVRPRLRHVGLAFLSLLRRPSLGRARGPAAATATVPVARLMGIAVRPDHRGTGLADELADRFCGRCAAAGIETVGLSVHEDNGRAIAFYVRSGWQRDRAARAGIGFVRPAAVAGPGRSS
ncbi:MAG TPA: GNAT family N-acetyltransferase [Candidatus Limnocylindrales bacterium]|nr:GNAT family N-acetyltransferase [Candidatus Limnocylindrales bacterium]